MFLAVVRAQHTIAVAACKQKKKIDRRWELSFR